MVTDGFSGPQLPPFAFARQIGLRNIARLKKVSLVSPPIGGLDQRDPDEQMRDYWYCERNQQSAGVTVGRR